MSSFSEWRLSELMVKESFSQMRAVGKGQLWKLNGLKQGGVPEALVLT
jgi:hypothetical protein